MHITDWLPTLLTAAGGNPSNLTSIDGMDLWNALSDDTESPRTSVLHNIDDIYGVSAITVGDYLTNVFIKCSKYSKAINITK